MVSERRSSPRVQAPVGAGGTIRSTTQVHVVDLSRSGVRFQLDGAVRPGSNYAFRADLDGFSLDVAIRITRCQAEPTPRGESRGLVYQAGAELLWESPAAEARYADWLDRRGLTRGPYQANLRG